MKLHSLLLLLIVLAIAAFAALNWNVFVVPTELSLGFTVVQIPLGLVMLGLLAFVTALFLAFVVYLQGSALLETRRHSRELQTHRELSDQAEASRFTELRAFLDTGLKGQNDLLAQSKAELIARIDLQERELQSRIEQSGNTLAAYIGELEDRLDTAHKTSGPT